MSDNRTEEFFQKLAPCIERGELDACVEGAARLAGEMEIGAEELLSISGQKIDSDKFEFAYVLALAAAQRLEGNAKAEAYLNTGVAAQYLGKTEKAEEHYKKVIDLNPKNSVAHFLFACFLLFYQQDQNRLLSEAKEHLEKAIKYDSKNAMAHTLYSIILFGDNKIESSRDEIVLASNLAKNTENIILNIFKAVLYQKYSEINFNQKKYKESSEDANIAGEEFLKAAESTEAHNIKNNLKLQGNVLKAKSFVRKVPRKSWYKKLRYRLGKNPNISEVIDNLKNAAIYYEKASLCTIGDKQDLCNACYSAISVFSEILSAMSSLIKGENPPINKNEWLSSLKQPREIYVMNKLNNGVALIDTLEQLINCVDELSNQKASGVNVQEYLKKCYTNLIDVSTKLDGALKVITYQSVDAIKDYLKTKGMGFVEEETKKSPFDNWLIKTIFGAAATIILGIIANQLFEWKIHVLIWNFIKSSILGTP